MPFSAPETIPISKAGAPGPSPLPSRSRASRSAIADDPRWQLVLRIAESHSLGKSPRLADFLRYVGDRQIRGKNDEITEQQIGVKVFGRSEGYNSNDDNIVRNYARMLRKRLEDYFRKEGRDELLVLSIPRGGYIPVFLPRDQVASIPETELHPLPDPRDSEAYSSHPKLISLDQV
jgi:hypothetical protein